MIDGIDSDIQVAMMPVDMGDGYQLGAVNEEEAEAIGRLAIELFTRLHQTQPKPPAMMGVVVIKKSVEVAAQPDEAVAVPVEDVVQEAVIVPVEEALQEVEITPMTQPNREEIELQIEGYLQEIRLLAQAVEQERQLLKTQEQIQILQQFNRGAQRVYLTEDPKAAGLKKIAELESQIAQIQRKVVDLQI